MSLGKNIQAFPEYGAERMGAPVAASDTVGLLKVMLDGELVVLPVYDGCRLSGQAPMSDPAAAVAIVVHGADRKLVLLVDRLVDVIVCDSLAPPPGGMNPDVPWISGYLHDGLAHTQPVFALDPGSLRLTP